MKKVILYSLLSTLLLTACSSKQETSQETATSQTTTSSESNPLAEAYQKALKSDASAFPQLSEAVADNEAQVLMHTSAGDITIKLFPEYAPLAVENFLTHAKEGYYDGVIFHRVIQGFMIQGGDPLGKGTGGESIWAGKDETIDSGNGFKNEITPFLYNLRGALAMANAGADTNGSQFFINQNKQDQTQQIPADVFPKPIFEAYKNGGNPTLDASYTVFGQVTKGMEVVDQIAAVETDEADKPKTDITITSIEILKDYTFK
ncbi:peptidylprolyl isomerase [Streptococcus ovuberis]|uniref:Peptidyl-prolyl cis-trans isomerase n=1 Tax=Streptococcus ovuberis TaxID=1936207 RepID=A0A7X6MXY6_9STRE|nr:peptidylprolyl isomerase [Streptococcus ovuberis]NKZ19784.1 peptidylprolyl isomerase [Streptococcus ovuberis]